MVGGQLHNEGGGVAGEHLRLFQHNAGDDDGSHTDEVGGGGDPCGTTEDRAGDHGDEGHFRTAGDERGGHDRHTAVTLVFNGTGGHDARDAAAGADEHRDEGLAGQAEFAEDTVEHEGDTGHVAAGLKEGEHQEQDQHLRHEAEHCADTGDDTVEDQAVEPVSRTGSVKRIADQNRDTGDPNAVVSRVGLVKAVLFEVADSVHIGHLDNIVHLVRALGQRVVVGGHLIDGEGLFILNVNGGGVFGGLEGLELFERRVGVEALIFHVEADERVSRFGRGGVIVARLAVGGGADAEQMPAVAEQAVVCPVGRGRAHADHSDPVHKEHHDREDGQAQPAVGDDLIDLIGGGELFRALFLVAALDELCDVDVALVGDDALGVVVELGLRRLDVLFDVVHRLGGDAELCEHLVVALKDLDRVPALLLFRHGVHGRLFDVGDGVLDRAGEGVHRDGLGALGGADGSLGSVHDAVALECGDLDDLAAKLTGELLDVDLITVLADDIHHVDGDDHGDAKLGKLGGEIQVTLEVRAVDDVQDRVGTLTDQVVTGDDFLQRVGGQGVNTGKVHDDHVIVLLELTFLLFHGDAGPVTDELVRTGQGVKQRRLTAVGVAREGNFDLLFHLSYCSFLLSFLNLCRNKLFNFDHFGVRLTQRQLVAAHGDLHRVAQGRDLAHEHLSALGDAHIHDTALDGALAMELDDFDGLADLDFTQCFHNLSPFI